MGHAQRVISMSPTITEIISELGGEDKIVGISTYCSFPKSACQKKQIGTALTPDMEEILKLRPDVIYSPQMKNSKIDLKAAQLGLKIRHLKFDSYLDIINSIKEVGEYLKSDKVNSIISKLEGPFSKLKKLTLKGEFLVVVDIGEKQGRVNSILSAGPETFLSDIIESTGLKNSAKIPAKSYERIELENLIQKEVTYFIFTPKKKNLKEKLGNELKRFNIQSRVYDFSSEYAVIPGPRLSLLMNDILKELMR